MPDRYKSGFEPPQHPPYCTCARCNDPEARVVAAIDEQQAQAHAAYLQRLQRAASHAAAEYRWNLPQGRTPSAPTGSSIGVPDDRRPGVPPSTLASPLPAASRFSGASVSAPQDKHSGTGVFLALLAGGMIALGIVAVTTFEIPDLFRQTLEVGCTGSMEPTLSCGDVIVVSSVGTTSPALERGDLIVFPRCPEDRLRNTRLAGLGSFAHLDQATVVHRIIEVGTDRNGDLAYRTKGDANTRAEPCWTKHRNVLFVVDEIVNGE